MQPAMTSTLCVMLCLRAVARRFQAGCEFVVYLSDDASSEKMTMLSKEAGGLVRMLLGSLAQRPGEGLDDHVVSIRGKQGADSRYFEKVVCVAAPAEGDGADQRGTPP